MSAMKPKAMRDVFIEGLTAKMYSDDSIFFLSGDFGSPKLDALRENFPDRFINVGIAEQNLINIATGLALEGFKVYAYAIAPFITMRCYEQIRVNLALLSQVRPMNVNLIGVGAGFSYDMSGPTHQALEDISIMRTLPNLEVFSPSDWVSSQAFVDYSVNETSIKYLRFDSKPLKFIYSTPADVDIKEGFKELKKGTDVCLISTGYMTHQALEVCKLNDSIGVIDFYMLKSFDEDKLKKTLSSYSRVITMEEGFKNRGGLDSLVMNFIRENKLQLDFENVGLRDHYSFEIGSRSSLHETHCMEPKSIIQLIKKSS